MSPQLSVYHILCIPYHFSKCYKSPILEVLQSPTGINKDLKRKKFACDLRSFLACPLTQSFCFSLISLALMTQFLHCHFHQCGWHSGWGGYSSWGGSTSAAAQKSKGANVLGSKEHFYRKPLRAAEEVTRSQSLASLSQHFKCLRLRFLKEWGEEAGSQLIIQAHKFDATECSYLQDDILAITW